MRASIAAALVVSLTLASGPLVQAVDAKEVDYTGWQIIVSGLEVTTATYHSDLGYTLDDKCTITKRGNSKYVVVETPDGAGLERFSTKRVSASTEISVSGQGKAHFYSAEPPQTRRWSYQLGPSDYPHDMESFHPSSGGVPQARPDEPMFMFRTIKVSSYVPETEWTVTAEGMAAAKDVILQAWDAAEEGDPPALEFVFPHRLDGDHLTASGSRSFDFDLNDLLPIEEVRGSASIRVSYSVTVIPTTNNGKPPRVALEEIDRNWWPEDGGSLTARIMVNGDKPAEAFRLTLYDVSQEPGVCGNSEDANTDPDLSFEPDGGWAVAGAGPWIATSGNGGREATIEIACHDWGAWGKLKGEALIDDKWEPAKVGGGLNYARIPYDDDDDHIADSWQAIHGVGGKAATDDSGKRPTVQANDGDGLSIYEDYRGFDILYEGKRDHVSPDPGQKVLFYIDEAGYFSPDVWEQCSGMKAYALSMAMTRPGPSPPDGARKVNFRSSYAKNGDKFCVVVTTIRGSYKDPDGDLPMGLASGPGGGCPTSPHDVESLYLYPDNALAWVNTFATKLGIAAAQPNSQEAKDFDQLGLPRAMWKRASDKLSEGYRQQLADQGTRQVAVHEMGHCCGLMGHYLKDDPAKREAIVGNRTCPMCYSDYSDGLQYIVLQVLMSPDAAMPAGRGQFCKDDDFDCWGHLNVKDN